MRKDIGKVRPRWPMWFSITLGMVTFAFLIIQITLPVNATDIWWHMALGRHILETGSLIVDHSIFTWTPATPYYTYNSWLADIILYLTYNHLGAGGLLALRYSIYFLLFCLAWHFALTRGIGGNPLAWVIILVASTLTWTAHLIKPELFTVGFFTIVIWLYFYIRYRGDSARWLPYLFPLILIVWVNVHGAFFISSLFFAAAIVGEIMNTMLCPSQAMPPRLKKNFFIAMALCIPAILASPFGYELPLTIIREVLANDNINKYIVSYKPTSEFNGPPLYLLDYMILTMMLFVLLLWQKLKNKNTDWVVILAFLGYSAIFTQVARVSFFLGPVFLFACLDLLGEKKDSWVWSRSKVNNTLLITLCLSITTLIGWRTINDNYCKLSCPINNIKRAFDISTSFPIAETEYIKENLSGTKIGNTYQSGGYLLYHLWPEKQIMIDPRYFPFRSWIDRYFAFTQGKNMDQFISNNTADYWLITYNNVATFQWFYQSSDWKLAFLGTVGAIFIPSDGLSEEPKISVNIEPLMGSGNINKAFLIAMQLDDLTFAEKIFEDTKNRTECTCSKHIALIQEMKDAIAGIRAYNDGKYEDAARILGKKTWNLVALKKAKSALLLLAEESWKREDIFGARKWYLEILKIQPTMTITDVYNFILLDWLYRDSDLMLSNDQSNDPHWQEFADFIIKQKGKMQPSQGFIVETAKAMKEGQYDGTASLVLSDGSFSPAPSERKKSNNRVKE